MKILSENKLMILINNRFQCSQKNVNLSYFLINYSSYMAEIRNPSDIPLPDDLKGGKERMVFGNVEAIYEWHRE